MKLKQLIDEFPLFSWLSEHNYETRGNTHVRIDCPHCLGRRSLSINIQKKYCQCFKCSEGGFGVGKWDGTGSLIDLISLVENLTRKNAIKRIAELSGHQDLDFKSYEEFHDPKKFFPEDCVLLEKADASHPSKKNLVERNLSHFVPYVFVCVSGLYVNRWILPCLFFDELVGFEAKSYFNHRPKSLFPYWLSTSETIYTTRQWDFNANFVVITESIFDAETLGCNAVGIYGSHLREGQLLKLIGLKDKGITTLIWFLDGDAFCKQRRQVLSLTRNFFENRIVRVPKDSDPNSLGTSTAWKFVSLSKSVNSGLDFL